MMLPLDIKALAIKAGFDQANEHDDERLERLAKLVADDCAMVVSYHHIIKSTDGTDITIAGSVNHAALIRGRYK